MKLKGSELSYQIAVYIIVSLLLIVSVFPLLYVVCVAFSTQEEMVERGRMMLIPYKPSFDAFTKIFVRNPMIKHSFLISVLRVIIGTSFTLSFTLIAGFVVSRRDMPGSKTLMFMVMVTILFGGGLIPTFLVIQSLGLYNNFWVMIIPGILDSWGVLVFRQFFLNLPREIEEAAEVDGVPKFKLLISIILPMSTAVIAALGLFMAVGHWNAWFDALIYLKDDDIKPLQYILYNIHRDASIGYNMNSTTDYNSARVSTASLRMALTVIGIVPILCVYPFLQKYFTKGVYVGAVKG